MEGITLGHPYPGEEVVTTTGSARDSRGLIARASHTAGFFGGPSCTPVKTVVVRDIDGGLMNTMSSLGLHETLSLVPRVHTVHSRDGGGHCCAVVANKVAYGPPVAVLAAPLMLRFWAVAFSGFGK